MRTIWQWLCGGRQLASVPRNAYMQNAIFGKFGIAAVASTACLLSACAPTLDYYWQSVWGEWQLLSGARPIPEVITDTKDEAVVRNNWIGGGGLTSSRSFVAWSRNPQFG